MKINIDRIITLSRAYRDVSLLARFFCPLSPFNFRIHFSFPQFVSLIDYIETIVQRAEYTVGRRTECYRFALDEKMENSIALNVNTPCFSQSHMD